MLRTDSGNNKFISYIPKCNLPNTKEVHVRLAYLFLSEYNTEYNNQPIKIWHAFYKYSVVNIHLDKFTNNKL